MRIVPVVAAAAFAIVLAPGGAAAYPKCTSYEQKVLGVSRDGRYVATALEHSHGGTHVSVSDASAEGAGVLVSETALESGEDLLERPLDFGKLELVRLADWPARSSAAGKEMAAAIRVRCGEATARRAAEPHAFADDEPPAVPSRALFGTSYVVLLYDLEGEGGCDDSMSGEEGRVRGAELPPARASSRRGQDPVRRGPARPRRHPPQSEEMQGGPRRERYRVAVTRRRVTRSRARGTTVVMSARPRAVLRPPARL